MPPDDICAAARQKIDEVTAGEAGRTGDEDQRGTPLSAPLKGEKFPRPASVNERKKR